ncbi:MAG TPA: UbiA family prenyltransferase [Actinomycetes bacterium]|nr:UbiA family prenyltransferase [Actinomycetes bacterium]
MTRTIRGLALGCHPGPTVVVTTITAALAVGVGQTLAGTVLAAVAVFVGQLSIGWSNDWLDATRDADSYRTDKPTATGDIRAGVLRNAALVALALDIPLSFLNGTSAGWAQLVLVGSGWAYTLELKRTVVSWLPYAFGFGALPAFITLGLSSEVWPPWWAMAVGALLGVGAHFANVLPDIDEDLAAGVLGLPQRLGTSRAGWLAIAFLVLASGLLVVAPGVATSWFTWLGFGVVLSLAGWAVRSLLPPESVATVFRAAMLIALVDAVLFVHSATAVTH